MIIKFEEKLVQMVLYKLPLQYRNKSKSKLVASLSPHGGEDNPGSVRTTKICQICKQTRKHTAYTERQLRNKQTNKLKRKNEMSNYQHVIRNYRLISPVLAF